MGLFSPGRRNELLNLLGRELGRYEKLRGRKKSRVRREVDVILDFIKFVKRLVELYYQHDFNKSNQEKIFEKASGKLDRHITSIIHRGRDCGFGPKIGSQIENFWRGKNIGELNPRKLQEKDVADFIYRIKDLLSFLYLKLEKV